MYKPVFALFVLLAGGCTYVPRTDSADREGRSTEASESSVVGDEGEGNASDLVPGQTGLVGDEREARPGIDAFPGSRLFLPAGTTPAPGIVMLHGSEGGAVPYLHDFGAEIAKRGFVVMTLCWFGCAGRSEKIERIPLESVVEAGRWLKGAPEVANGKVGLFGWSRGAELALLLTSLLGGTDPYGAVAVHAPSDTVVTGFDPTTQDSPPNYGSILERDPQTGRTILGPAWTWRGQPLFGEKNADFSDRGPRIAVERFIGPVYVSHGERDELWEVARGRRVVAARKAVPSLVTEAHFFPNEGHVLERPANVATWTAEIVSFFQRMLAP